MKPEIRTKIETLIHKANVSDGDCTTEDKFQTLIEAPIRSGEFTRMEAWKVFFGDDAELVSETVN